jgi:hypothetical protein
VNKTCKKLIQKTIIYTRNSSKTTYFEIISDPTLWQVAERPGLFAAHPHPASPLKGEERDESEDIKAHLAEFRRSMGWDRERRGVGSTARGEPTKCGS